jgi:hypothetical protein
MEFATSLVALLSLCQIDAAPGKITDQQTVGFITQQLAAFAKFIERMAPKN